MWVKSEEYINVPKIRNIGSISQKNENQSNIRYFTTTEGWTPVYDTLVHGTTNKLGLQIMKMMEQEVFMDNDMQIQRKELVQVIRYFSQKDGFQQQVRIFQQN